MSQHVLIAFDGTPQSHAALQHAIETYPDADLTALYVINPAEHGFTREALENAQAAADTALSNATDLGREFGREIETAVERGGTSNVIVEFAESNDIDHLVMGSHGRKGLARFLLGSVAETVARRAPVSVTVIREADPGTDR